MIKKICLKCNKEFLVIPFRKNKAKYCSKKCRADYLNKIIKCQNCGKEFMICVSWSKRRKYCSLKCFNKSKKINEIYWNRKGEKNSEEHKRKLSEALKGKYCGKNNSNWKDGIHYNSQGYVMQYVSNGIYIRRSHLVAEKYLGRYLFNDEIVHHINGIKDDDRPKNLYVFSNNTKHLKYHHNPYPLKSNLKK